MSDPIQVLALLQSCSDEGDMEYVMNASADRSISNPMLSLGKGSGRGKAAQADKKHAGANYDLYKTDSGLILINPLRMLIRELGKVVEYRTQRPRNPQLYEDAVQTELGIWRMAMIGKCVLNSWVDPEQERLFYSQTRQQRLAAYAQITTS